MWTPGNRIPSFSEKESRCEFIFKDSVRRYGPFWHLCTPGNRQEIFNLSEEDYRFSITNLAISLFESGAKALTDAHMENHLHALLSGTEAQCRNTIRRYIQCLKHYHTRSGRETDLSGLEAYQLIPVADLKAVRNEIAYINRNGYVSNPDYLPFSYPWSGGSIYFNPEARIKGGYSYNLLPFREKRLLSCRRVQALPDSYRVRGGQITFESYLDYALGESLFRDAHHYFDAITKNFEAYSEEAKRLGDTAVLGREEIYSAARMICMRDFNVKQPSLLSPSDKIRVAQMMHSDYHASNAQIRMILKMSEADVNQLFPLKALSRR